MKRLSVLVCLFVFALLALQPRVETQAHSDTSSIALAGGGEASSERTGRSEREETSKPVEESELRSASASAIKLIQHSQVVWSGRETCTSCHHQLLPEIPIRLARERGVAVDENTARKSSVAAFGYLKDLDAAVQGYDYIDVLFDAWALVAAHEAGVASSLSTSAYAQAIASHQLSDGSWFTIDVRPPQAHSQFATTALSARVLGVYLPESLRSERIARVSHARDWLLKTQPKTTEDQVFRLMGLAWTGADKVARGKAASALMGEQRADGGWSQLPGCASDAYATGQALATLHEAGGLATSDRAYQRGLRFLLQTQRQDGSWLVKSRLHPPAPVSPPYFETGFPYQHDQFISMMGTAWSATALLHAIPVDARAAAKARVLSEIVPDDNSKWIDAALNGSANELRRLLDSGVKPNSRTAEGTTALMLAARDLAKVKLLVERGADVNASAKTGITPLMVAAHHAGNVAVVRLLLEKGARPNVDKGVEVRNDASPFFMAVMANDVSIAAALAGAGARTGDRMKILGRFALSPMVYAVFAAEPKMLEYLISRGASPGEADDDGISVLSWATIANRANAVQSLLARGARVNSTDRFGMTPLLYAASIDFGDTLVMERLIAAGADLKSKNKDGLSPLDLTNSYQHTAMSSLLTGR